jgi:hypothetical protein
MQIRRFDIFAEYKRLEAEAKGVDADEAKGYGLWLAKVVAARKFARKGETKAAMTDKLRRGADEDELVDGKYRSLDGEPQTAELFEREIVERMGEEFYREVFQPALRDAFERKERYEDVRDALRTGWNAARKAGGRASR